MKVGIITQPNQKGQIVIPKEIREKLGINSSVPLNLVLRGGGIYIYPVEEVVAKGERENVYLEVLKRTQGTWVGEAWGRLTKVRKKMEIEASGRRKKTW